MLDPYIDWLWPSRKWQALTQSRNHNKSLRVETKNAHPPHK